MEPLTALSSLTGRTISIARARRSIRTANSDLAAAFRRRRRHKVVRDVMPWCGYPVEPGIRGTRPSHLTNPGKQKRDPRGPRTRLPRAGDPQTYALLHCSVFKERTLPPGPFRTGSLTAPKGRGVRVNEGYSSTACLRCQHPTTRYSPRPYPQLARRADRATGILPSRLP